MLFHFSSLRYALALWLATVLALLVSFFLQLEPAQWSAITVWIVFIQTPTMNYSKIIWWAFGTTVGAFMAVLLIVFFNQTPELLLLSLALWLSVCAAAGTLVRGYRDYGAVLAGYTCAIVTMSAADQPDLIFRLAVTRVSCIFIGMTSAILMIIILLPKHLHWGRTLKHLGEHLNATLSHAAKALAVDSTHPGHFAWRQMVDRLSTLEHSLDMTTAESADSRIHAAQARSLVATLFSLLAKAQAVEVHLSRPGAVDPPGDVRGLLARTRTLLEHFAGMASSITANDWTLLVCNDVGDLRYEVAILREAIAGQAVAKSISARFILDRLDEILQNLAYAVQDWAGLFGPWLSRRASHLAVHHDYRTAFLYGLRMFLAITMASAIWFITGWPSGAMFVLFISVVCSLLSLVEHAPVLGFDFVKSAFFCFIMAYFYNFWLLQHAEGFLLLALALGLFLIPAAYAYRNPPLKGSAVVSMLIFYGLTSPSNEMVYDISGFMNNGIALLCAAVCGFFAFHAVPSLTPATKRFRLLRAIRHDLTFAGLRDGPLSEQGWAALMFDRLRLLHRNVSEQAQPAELREQENEVLLSLQLGLRQRRLRTLVEAGDMTTDSKAMGMTVLRTFRKISNQPDAVARYLGFACARLRDGVGGDAASMPEGTLGALAEMSEMALLIETAAPFYADPNGDAAPPIRAEMATPRNGRRQRDLLAVEQ